MKKDVLVIPYGDRISGVALWWKSLLLLPPWVFLLLICAGSILKQAGLQDEVWSIS